VGRSDGCIDERNYNRGVCIIQIQCTQKTRFFRRVAGVKVHGYPNTPGCRSRRLPTKAGIEMASELFSTGKISVPQDTDR
jgi:hypothetical protein